MINPNVLFPTKTNAPGGGYSYGSARNVTTPGDGTGTPWDEAILNDWFGFQQFMIDSASVVPSGSSDSETANDMYDAIAATLSPPGAVLFGAYNDTPTNLGLRLIKLDGSSVLIANYPDLVANTYVGDGSNAAVAAAGGHFYKSSDSGGSTPDTAGPYFQLPDLRGKFIRGLDDAGQADPDSPRLLGDFQAWAVLEHWHEIYNTTQSAQARETITAVGTGASYTGLATSVGSNPLRTFDVMDYTDSAVASANREDLETRPVNTAFDVYIRF